MIFVDIQLCKTTFEQVMHSREICQGKRVNTLGILAQSLLKGSGVKQIRMRQSLGGGNFTSLLASLIERGPMISTFQ